MRQMNRRNFVLSTTMAGIVFGLDKPLEIFPSALAQSAGPHPMNPKGALFHKFKVGGIDVTTVYDGGIYREHDAAFIKNASIDDTKASLKASNLPEDRVPNSYTVTFVTIGGRTYMFDSGNGVGGAPGTGVLAENMKAAGIDASKLAAIVVGHFHPDHIFGLYTKDTAQVFANTEINVPGRIQVLGRSSFGREVAGGPSRSRPPDSGDLAAMEEHQAGRQRQGRRRGYSCRPDARPHTWPHELPRL